MVGRGEICFCVCLDKKLPFLARLEGEVRAGSENDGRILLFAMAQRF